MSAPGIDGLVERYGALVSGALETALPEASGFLAKIHEAMRYAVLGGGKRLRPMLCLASCEAAGGEPEAAIRPAVALELVHGYSLVHDDLPCMDDDDTRRGRPTTHIAYGEALAVLAGDGLLTRAFEILAEDPGHSGPARVLSMVKILAQGAGSRGMVGGQALDLGVEGTEDVDLPTLQYIHTRKTGALLGASCRLGALAGGAAGPEVEILGRFGEKTGLAFQIVDDLLDETGRPEELGKASNKDRARGKATYPSVLGVEESRRRVEELGREAAAIVEPFGERAEPLRVLARFIVERSF